MLDIEELLAALGKPYSHDAVQSIVHKLGVTKVPSAKGQDPISSLSVKKHGIELGFIDADYLAGRKVARYGKAEMIFHSASLYTKDGEPGFHEYQGTLPGGGRITDSLESVVARLGPPAEVHEDEGVVISRGWKRDRYWFSLAYRWDGPFRFASVILEEYLRSK